MSLILSILVVQRMVIEIIGQMNIGQTADCGRMLYTRQWRAEQILRK